MTRGKRDCRRHADQLVCPSCCVSTRSNECEGCGHYEMSERYTAQKIRGKSPEKHFMAVYDPYVDGEVDRILRLIESGQLENAEGDISRLLAENPRNQNVYFCAGVFEIKREDWKKAIECFDKAIEIFPYFVEAYSNKLGCCREILDVKNAVRVARKVVMYGDPKEEYFREAEKFLDQMGHGIKEDSGMSLDEFLSHNDMYDEAVKLVDIKQYARALPIFEECLVKHSKHTRTLNNIGICLIYLDRKDEAIIYFGKALATDPSYAPAMLNLQAAKSGMDMKDIPYLSVDFSMSELVQKKIDMVFELCERGKFTDAEKIIAPLLKQHPRDYRVQFAAGMIRMDEDKYDEAVKFLDKAIELFPADGLSYYNKGICHNEMCQGKEAIASYKKAIALLDPSEEPYLDAKKFLEEKEAEVLAEYGTGLDEYLEYSDMFEEADKLIRSKDFTSALPIYNTLLGKFPRQKRIMNNIGICHLELGKKDEAEKYFRKALEIDPEYKCPQMNLRTIGMLNANAGKGLTSDLAYSDELESHETRRESYFRKVKDALFRRKD